MLRSQEHMNTSDAYFTKLLTASVTAVFIIFHGIEVTDGRFLNRY
jgi:hypothetical protein